MRSRHAWWSFVVLFAAMGCGSSDTSGSGGGTSGGMSLKIVSPASGACVDVPVDRVVYVPVTIETSGLALKPPGTCGATTACGNVVLSVGETRNNAGAALVIDLVSTPDKPLSGTIPLQAKVVADDGSDVLDAAGKAITAAVTFEAKVSCEGNTGGTGGSTTSTGGAGGSTTSSTTSTSSGGAGGSTMTGGAGGSTTSSTSSTTSTGGAGGTTLTAGTGGM